MKNTTIVRSVAGPDAGWTVTLGTGSHWMGRSRGSIRVFDPAIEVHHALVAVRPDGGVALLQTTGRTPVLVDGDPARGWVQIRRSSTVELGATRLQFGAPETPSGPPVEWIFEPQNDSPTELARFERDVRLAVATTRRRAIAPVAGAVELGVADLELAVSVRRADGSEVDRASLDHAAHAVLDRTCRATVPVRTVLHPHRPLAIVADDAYAVAAGLVSQLAGGERARVIVADAAECAGFAATGRPLVVLAADRLDVPVECRAILEVGSTWRATWCEDAVDHPDREIRLHARGRSSRRDAAGFDRPGRSSRATGSTRASTDVDGALVAQEVPRPGAEFGGDVVGVPESARRQ